MHNGLSLINFIFLITEATPYFLISSYSSFPLYEYLWFQYVFFYSTLWSMIILGFLWLSYNYYTIGF